MLITLPQPPRDPRTFVNDILGSSGTLAQKLPGFETRPEQLQMAQAVAVSLEKKHHLAVEAGTGVGKSFAYLVPAVKKLQRDQGRILVSTFTINLQQQLMQKDIPLLQQTLDIPVNACLAKGRSNYLCLRRLNYARTKQKFLFSDMGTEIENLLLWAQTTEDGSLADLKNAPSMKVWDTVCSEHGNCPGRRCKHFQDCFYRKARRKLETANLIIANHALLFSDLVLKDQNYKLLPEYSEIIIDEAHNIEHVAEDHLGISASNLALDYLFNDLYNPRRRKGLLAWLEDAKNARSLLKNARESAKIFFTQVQAWYDHTAKTHNGRAEKECVTDNLSGPLRELRLELARLEKGLKDDDDKLEISRYVERCRDFEISVRDFLTQPSENHVYWIETSFSRKKRVLLRSAPLNPGPDIKRLLFEPFSSVITTSATLSCQGEKGKQGFEFFASRIGLEEYEGLRLGSPFDYSSQVTLYIEADLPEPNHEQFSAMASRAIQRYLLQTEGRAFVLFTSYSMLNNFAKTLGPWMAQHDLDLLCQGAGQDRSELLETFRQDNRSVLFGTDSFWQGVDVPGQALSNVIIVRLPFAVPNHPLTSGRIEHLKQNGQDPFYDYQLPTAILKFKQGFGRLIRTKTDSGIIVVLDSRIVRRGYGKHFLDAVPKAKVEIVRANDWDQSPESME